VHLEPDSSAPKGLYWLSGDPFTKGRWVVRLSQERADAQWAEARGFVGKDWPLLKQVSGVLGRRNLPKGVDVFDQ
jgi:type IV secretory pathway protease TraF